MTKENENTNFPPSNDCRSWHEMTEERRQNTENERHRNTANL